MVKLVTSCKECTNYNAKDQTCTKNLYAIFSNRNADIKYLDDDVTIDRICPHKNIPINDTKNPYIFGTIILVTNNLEDLSSTLDALNKEKNIENFKIIVLYKEVNYSNIVKICNDKIASSYKVILMLTENLPYHIFKSMAYAKNGMIFIIECDKEFEPNMIDKIDNMINRKLYRILHVHNDDQVHGSVTMAHIYRWIKGHLGISLLEKIKDIASQENSDPQIFTWKEVNEQYIN